MLRFVFFDVGSTLLVATRERMLAPLHERKIVPSEQQLRALESEVKNQFDDILEHNGRLTTAFGICFTRGCSRISNCVTSRCGSG